MDFSGHPAPHPRCRHGVHRGFGDLRPPSPYMGGRHHGWAEALGGPCDFGGFAFAHQIAGPRPTIARAMTGGWIR